MFQNILVVCVGNICRSPVGELLLKEKLPHLNIDSAGISALVDRPAVDEMINLTSQDGLDLSKHRAKQLTEQLCSKADLILVMERDHINKVCELLPSARSKVMLFGQWLEVGEQKIEDPFLKSIDVFENCYQKLIRSSELWVKKLK